MDQTIQITITGRGPYGVRIKGGIEFGLPIIVENVTAKGKAEASGVLAGDHIVSINGVDVTTATHDKAKTQIVEAKDVLLLVVKRNLNRSSVDRSVGAQIPTRIPYTAPCDVKTSGTTQSTYVYPKPVQQIPPPTAPTSKPPQTAPTSYPPQTAPTSYPPQTAPTSYPRSTFDPPPKPIVIVGNSAYDSRPPGGFTQYCPPEYGPNSTVTTSKLDTHVEAKYCQSCKEKILGSFINIEGRQWHSQHFNCDNCKTNLANVGFFEQNHGIFCKGCYGDLYSQKCAACNMPCVEKYVTSGSKTYHSSCFNCKKCGTSLSEKPFNLHDGFPHCMDCLGDLVSTKCTGCKKSIKPGEEFVEAREKPYHSSCFICNVCGCNLAQKGKFNMKNDLPTCIEHA